MIRPARLVLPLLLIPASPAPAEEPAEPLLWPTDAGRCVTSGFCEFRPDHFHSGIDISTGGRVGFCFRSAVMPPPWIMKPLITRWNTVPL